jgi:hypothetical protein
MVHFLKQQIVLAAQVVELLPSKYKVLSSSSSTLKKRGREGKRKEGERKKRERVFWYSKYATLTALSSTPCLQGL